MSDRFQTFAFAAACAGMASLIIGGFALANMGDHLVSLGTRSAGPAGRAFLIAGELVATVAFTLAALGCLVLRDRPVQRGLISMASAVIKLLVLIGLLVGYWHIWYFMLDMRGPDSLSLLVIVLSGLQAVFLILTAMAGRRPAGN